MYFVLKIKLIVMTDWSVENMNPGIAQNWRLLNVSALPKLSKTYIQHLILVSLLEPMVGEVFTSISIHLCHLSSARKLFTFLSPCLKPCKQTLSRNLYSLTQLNVTFQNVFSSGKQTIMSGTIQSIVIVVDPYQLFSEKFDLVQICIKYTS